MQNVLLYKEYSKVVSVTRMSHYVQMLRQFNPRIAYFFNRGMNIPIKSKSILAMTGNLL